jgi:hypothetical protein
LDVKVTRTGVAMSGGKKKRAYATQNNSAPKYSFVLPPHFDVT